MANSSSVALATNIFTAPREAFVALKEQPRVLLPVLVLVIASSVVSFYFLTHVDIGFFLDNQLRANPSLTDAQREQMVATAARVSPLFYATIGAVGSILYRFLVIFLLAGYFTIVSSVTHDGVKLKQWFALTCWCMLPLVLGVLAVLVNVLVNDPRFMLPDSINPLGFGNLLSIDPTGTPMIQRLLLGIDVTAIWTIVLLVVGYQTFTKKPYATSAAIVLGPIALIVAIGTLFALRR